MNSVQENIYAVYKVNERKNKRDLEDAHFEQQMFIVNPQMYNEYKKRQREEEESGNSNVTWIAPDSVEEAKQLMGVFADIEHQIKGDTEEIAANQEFVKQAGLFDILAGININEIGGD